MRSACSACGTYCQRSVFNLTSSNVCCVCTVNRDDCSEREYRAAACCYCKDRRHAKQEQDIVKSDVHCFMVWDASVHGWKRFIST